MKANETATPEAQAKIKLGTSDMFDALTSAQHIRRVPPLETAPGPHGPTGDRQPVASRSARTRTPHPRTQRIAIRLSEAELTRFENKALAAGRTPSDYFRECIDRSQVIARPKPSIDRRRALFLVNKASNNLNQLAHQINAAHLAGKVDASTYPKVLVELEMIAHYLRAMAADVD